MVELSTQHSALVSEVFLPCEYYIFDTWFETHRDAINLSCLVRQERDLLAVQPVHRIRFEDIIVIVLQRRPQTMQVHSQLLALQRDVHHPDRKSTRLNSSH